MGVGDVNFVGVTVLELEQDAPGPVHINRPKIAQVALELVQTNAVESAERIERRRGVQFGQSLSRECFIQAGKSRLPLFDETARRGAKN
ncbi:MAG TPA: hypothetical protein VNW90_20310 [Acetobacteraceae bacterium]|nr:hypothetical protein [Acetobacteraceae bacterium]